MKRMKKLFAANSSSLGVLWTAKPRPAVTSSPANIHRKAWVRNAAWRRASGLTPSADGDAYGVGMRFSVIGVRLLVGRVTCADP